MLNCFWRFKGRDDLLHQDCVDVLWSYLIDNDQITRQLSSDSDSNVQTEETKSRSRSCEIPKIVHNWWWENVFYRASKTASRMNVISFQVQELVEDIKHSLDLRLHELDWMDEATKEAARAKVHNLTQLVHHRHDSLPDLFSIWKEFNYFFAIPFFPGGLIDCLVR